MEKGNESRRGRGRGKGRGRGREGGPWQFITVINFLQIARSGYHFGIRDIQAATVNMLYELLSHSLCKHLFYL